MVNTYFGKPCKHGHGAAEGKCLRYKSNGGCLACMAARQLSNNARPEGIKPSLQVSHARRKDALKAGERFYWMTRPCSRGHLELRYASTGICRQCQVFFNLKRDL